MDGQPTCKLYCNLCKNTNRHTLIGSKEYVLIGDGPEPAFEGEYRFWACAGCDTCTMEDRYTAEYMVGDDGDQEFDSIFHPKRTHSSRQSKYFVNLPKKLSSLYQEVIISNNEELPLLCGAGLRALIEGVCADKEISGSDLKKKIEGMSTLLPANIVRNLDGFRFIGNRAVHELEAPEPQEITWALDVIEDILNYLYALDYKANLLSKVKGFQPHGGLPAAEPARKEQPPAEGGSRGETS